jgi:hypothetical protein
MSVIKTPFGFLEVGKEGIGADASQSGQTGFGVAPERLNAIDVASSPGEFIGAVVNPIMLVAFENQTVVSAPPGKGSVPHNNIFLAFQHLFKVFVENDRELTARTGFGLEWSGIL